MAAYTIVVDDEMQKVVVELKSNYDSTSDRLNEELLRTLDNLPDRHNLFIDFSNVSNARDVAVILASNNSSMAKHPTIKRTAVITEHADLFRGATSLELVGYRLSDFFSTMEEAETALDS